MKAYCLKTETVINPFGDSVSETRIMDRPLSEHQREALEKAGVTLVETVPEDEPYLLYSDRTWFTPELIEKIVQGDPGRLQVTNDKWVIQEEALQDLDGPGLYEIALMPPNTDPVFTECPLRKEVLDLNPVDPATFINAAQHRLFSEPEKQPFWMGTEMVVQIDHWMHILKANYLSLSYALEKGKRDFKTASLFSKLKGITTILLKARSFNKWKIMGQLNDIEKGAEIHPTAVVEFSTVKKGAKIGPFAVVRGSYIGEEAVIEQYAVVQLSVVCQKAILGVRSMFNLCVAYPGAMVSFGSGYQACLFGSESFMALGATILDLSFGKSIKVQKNDGTGRVDSGTHFLGAVVGHQAIVGNNVRIGYGASVPNDAFLVASPEELLRDWNDAPVCEAVNVRNGKAVPVNGFTSTYETKAG